MKTEGEGDDGVRTAREASGGGGDGDGTAMGMAMLGGDGLKMRCQQQRRRV
jgi:hypothetical protein